ncbi:MAG: hypothetical protein MUO76_05635 [Anaerolineaceae bacterium]|nr:hypothetical protein [Anaerolineaceae bacterium]
MPLQGMFGDNSILSVDPASKSKGEILGMCGHSVLYDGQVLWVARTGEVVGVDTTSREIIARAILNNLDTFVYDMTFDGEYLWVLDSNGAVQNMQVR